MDIKQIYENINIEKQAEYQIKVKGDLQLLEKILEIYQTIQVTSESADSDHQVCMITISNTTQQHLLVFIQMLLRFQYPIISVMCTNVLPKKTDDTQSNNDSSIAISA